MPKKKTTKKKKRDELDDIPPKLRKLITGCVEDYRYTIGKAEYRGEILWMDEDDKEAETEDAYLAASVRVDPRYLTARFSIYPRLVNDWKKKIKSDDDVRKIIAHEVAHIATVQVLRLATIPYKTEEEMKDHWEALTETIGRLIYNVNHK